MYLDPPASASPPPAGAPPPRRCDKLDLTFWYAPTAFHAYQISCVSCGITAVAAIVGFAAFSAAGSPAMLGFGLESLVDLFSSMVVVWRFYVGGDENPSPALIAKLDGREKKASILIAVVLMILGVVVSATAISHLAENEHGSNDGLLLGLSLPSVFIFGTLTVIKFRMANMLRSRTCCCRRLRCSFRVVG
jgi:hypothetical protein